MQRISIGDWAFAGNPVQTKWSAPDSVSIFNRCVIRVSGRDDVVRALLEAEISQASTHHDRNEL